MRAIALSIVVVAGFWIFLKTGNEIVLVGTGLALLWLCREALRPGQ
jgi:hypothetical protein